MFKNSEYVLYSMKNKRGVSDVVTQVFLIILTIVVVGVVFVFLFDILKVDSIDLSDLDLSMNIEGSYRNELIPSKIINADEYKETAYVTVQRGDGDDRLTGLKFVFTVDGNSYSCIRRSVPQKLETSIYAFKSSLFNKKPEKVEVVPLVFVDGKEKIAKSGYSVAFSDTNMDLVEKVDECGGFCCNSGDDLPANPVVPGK
jgi:hypothetical protein